MATGTEILNYRGDANLALGGGAGLDVYGVPDLSPISQTARDVALHSFAKNQMLYRQRIADRDAAFKMIDDEALVLDNILEEDRPIVDAQMKEIEKVWDKYQGDMLKDPMRYREFQRSIANAKNHINQAHKRYLGVQGDLEAKKKMATNPVDQRNFDRNVVGQVQKGFWSTYTPYVPTSPFDLKVVAAKPIYGAPVQLTEGEFDITTQTLDPEKTFNEYQKNWASREYNHMFNEYVEGFLTGPNADADVARINDGIAKMNAELGTNVAPLGVVKDPATGRYVANKDRVDQVAAKIALADNAAKLSTREFSKERAGVNVDREAIRQRAREAEMQNALGWAQLRQKKNEFDKEFGAKTSSTKQGLSNSAWTYATNMFGQLAGMGRTAFDKRTGKQEGVLIQPQDMNRLTPQQQTYLGNFTFEEGKLKINGVEFPEGDALFITDDLKVMQVPASELRGGVDKFSFNRERAKTVADIMQVATNRAKDEVASGTGNEIGVFNNIDLQGQGGAGYTGATTTNTQTTGRQYKQSYTMPNGAAKTVQELKGMGYTDEQINKYIDEGVIK